MSDLPAGTEFPAEADPLAIDETARTVGVVVPDVSSAGQGSNVYTEACPRRIVSIRCGFGVDFDDQLYIASRNNVERAYGDGKLDGIITYGVPIVAEGSAEQHFEAWLRVLGKTPPEYLLTIMSDWETWRRADYEQHGDHSEFANQLFDLCAEYMGHPRGAIWYGNRSDLAELIPHRQARPGIVASYGSELVFHEEAHAIGQQYTNGVITGPPGLPLSSAPWGRCDHNVFPGFTDARSLRAFLRPEVTVDVKKEVAQAVQDALTPVHKTLGTHHRRIANLHTIATDADARLHALDGKDAPKLPFPNPDQEGHHAK